MPRTTADAAVNDFMQDSTCNSSNGYLGQRFLHKSGDRSVMLLYDIKGTIAGIQTSIPSSAGIPSEKMEQLHNVFLDEDDFKTLTAYFVDPSTICSSGRDVSALDSQGTGDGIRFQIGSPNNATGRVQTLSVPHEEKDIESTAWTKGKCVIFTGMHYWYNIGDDVDCDEFFPAFPMYNKGKLTGFGFAMRAFIEGTHFEHPTGEMAKNFVPSIPKCDGQPQQPQTLTTIHIYFTDMPWLHQCWF